MTGRSRSYEQRLGLEVLKSTAQTFIMELEKEHVFGELEIEPFSEELAHRMVELIFGIFPAIEGDVRVAFVEDREKAAGLESGPDEHLPFQERGSRKHIRSPPPWAERINHPN